MTANSTVAWMKEENIIVIKPPSVVAADPSGCSLSCSSSAACSVMSHIRKVLSGGQKVGLLGRYIKVRGNVEGIDQLVSHHQKDHFHRPLCANA